MLGILKRYTSILVALGVFGLLTFVTLDNLILNLGAAVPGGNFDYALFYWDLWWAKYALLKLHTNPLLTNYVLFPNTVNLSLHTHVLSLGLMTLPFQAFVDMPWILNSLIAGSFLLASFLMFVFLRRHVRNTALSILGGALFAFTPAMLGHAEDTGLNTLPLWWLPLCLLLWDLTLERRSIGWALALGMCVYLAFMTHIEFIFWIMLTLSPYMVYGLFTQTAPRERWRVLGLGFGAALAAFLPALAMPLPQLREARLGGYTWEPLSTVHYYSLPIAALFTRLEGGERGTLGQTLPALVLVGLALPSRRRQRWLWLGAGLVGLILALGPYLDDPSQPLPFMLIYNLTQGQYRTPVRLITPATLALAGFVVQSLSDSFDRLRRQWIQAAIVTAILAIYVVDIGILEPFPARTLPDYPVYRLIGADPEDHTLLQVPLGVTSGSRTIGRGAELVYYARFHHQRTLNGMISRVPGGQMARFERAAFIRALANLNPLPPLGEARSEFLRRLKEWDIRYIVVHRDLAETDTARTFVEFFNLQPELCVFDDATDTIAYRVISSWADCPRPELTAPPSDGKVSMGEPTHDRFIGTGWYDVENIGGPQGRWAGEIPTSTLRILLPRQNIRVSFSALAYPLHQNVTLLVNGQPVGHFDLTDSWQVHQFDLPAAAVSAVGPTWIELRHAALLSAAQRGESPDERPLAAAYTWFEFVPIGQ
jgi:hypothetical protein